LISERGGKGRVPVRVRGSLTVASLCLIALLATTAQAGDSMTRGISLSAVARDRTTRDMPDDAGGPQVHFLYVVPSDGVDRQLDTSGGMEQSIARIEHWFEAQTGDQALRIDTYKGTPDITFVRLPHSDAQATSTNPWPLWVIGEDLVAAGFNDPAKVYAAFYEGDSKWACGGATSPALAKFGAMYLQAWPANGPRPCSDAPGFGTGTDRPGYFEIGLLHEVLHVIGFTPRCAPHASSDGYGDHVNDSPTDLMYGPDAKSPAGWNWSQAVLDYKHDDYYRAHISGCPDLSESPYLEQIPSFNLTVKIRGHGSVDTLIGSTSPKRCRAACTFSALRGSVMTLSATPAADSRFVAWSEGCSGKSGCQLTIASSMSVTATFSAKPKPKCRKAQKSTKKHPCVRK
jgi:List-Bact-rpt repeat protein